MSAREESDDLAAIARQLQALEAQRASITAEMNRLKRLQRATHRAMVRKRKAAGGA
jgi:prefoldin subunit 5